MAEREDRGNAILSTEPLIDVRAHRVAVRQAASRRSVRARPLRAKATASSSIRVVSTHLDTNGDRVAQAAALSEHLTILAGIPVVIGGDLNSRGGMDDDAVLALARRFPLASCGTGRTNRWPLRLDVLVPIGRLDFMFAAMETRDGPQLRNAA